MKNEFVIYLNAKEKKEYNSYILFSTEDKEEIDNFFNQYLAIELLSKKVKYKDDGRIMYLFNITKQKEDEIALIFSSGVNQRILDEIPISFN